jgi:hypothetical protein
MRHGREWSAMDLRHALRDLARSDRRSSSSATRARSRKRRKQSRKAYSYRAVPQLYRNSEMLSGEGHFGPVASVDRQNAVAFASLAPRALDEAAVNGSREMVTS